MCHRLAPGTAALLFLVNSGLTGITISFALLAFTGESVAATLVVTAGMFGALALYGTVTRRDVSGLGQFLFMGLIGVVLAAFVNVFWQNDAFHRGVVHRRHRFRGTSRTVMPTSSRRAVRDNSARWCDFSTRFSRRRDLQSSAARDCRFPSTLFSHS